VAGASHALHADGDGARGLDLADEVDGADVDAEFKRSRRDEHADFAVLQTMFGVEAELAREAAVVAGDVFFTEALAEGEGEAFGHFARIDEDQGGAMFQGELGEAVVDAFPDGHGGDRAQLVGGDFDAEVELAALACLDDADIITARAAQELRNQLDGVLGGGEANA
jgi:hypothetical protein